MVVYIYIKPFYGTIIAYLIELYSLFEAINYEREKI